MRGHLRFPSLNLPLKKAKVPLFNLIKDAIKSLLEISLKFKLEKSVPMMNKTPKFICHKKTEKKEFLKISLISLA